MESFQVRTSGRTDLRDITAEVQAAVRRSGLGSGWALVYVPHTTAGITINENADPSVIHDLAESLERLAPWEQPFYRHSEGNSAAHIKASLMGSSVSIPVERGQLALGQWQGIFLCEFDGPRTRRVCVQAGASSRSAAE
jgi:secondary thiamine-phosphate synthase enzyme